ncbi:MAG TPA: DUF3175 domain-containing protein [Pirellulales bacterium]|jgi:tRNA(adenine34) deaminase|nr:DUF3175 domain-containing protein [Pirellulales bacterium]
MAKKKRKASHRWVRNVKTDSTHPPEHTFDQPAEKIAEIMADPKISPKGLGSAIRMVQYYVNRGGKGLSASRKRELEKAKQLLQEKREREGGKKPRKKSKKKAAKSKRRTTKKRKKRQSA